MWFVFGETSLALVVCFFVYMQVNSEGCGLVLVKFGE